MRIITRLRLISRLTLSALIVLAPTLIWSFIEFKNSKSNYFLADTIKANFFERASFRDQYFLYREDRTRVQWEESKEIADHLLHQAETQFDSEKDRQILERLHKNIEDSENIFHRIINNTEALKTATGNRQIYEELDKRLASQQLLKSAAIRDMVTALQERSAQRVEQTYKHLIIIIGLFAFALALVTILTSIQLGRLIRKRLAPLHEGARIVAEGDLDFRIQCEGTDEFSELAVSINFMTDKLQAFTLLLETEISERKRLAQEREQFFRFFQLSMDPMCIADPYGCFKHVNPTFVHLTGFEESELLAKPFLEFILPADRQRTSDEMKQQVEIRRSLHFENRFVCKDGRVILLSWTAYFDKSDGVTYATAHDITEIRQVEEALRHSEQQFRTLAEAVPQIVWITTPDGKNIYFNQQWVDYTGLTLEESYGDGWNTPFHPDDRQRAWDAWQHATQTDGIYSLECRLRRADGVYRWWLIRGASLHDANGKVINWFGTCTDIEDIKQTEQKLQLAASVFTHAREGIMITAADGTIIDVNDAFSQITGYSREEVLDRNPRILKSGRHDQEFYAALWRNLIEKGHWYGEIWNRRNNGEVYVEMKTISAIRDTEGNIRQYVALFSDITARKKMEEELKRSNAELDQFAYAVSHDMRQPLRMVTSYLSLIKKALAEQLDEDTRLYLSYASDGAKRMDQMILSMLDFSRVGRKTDPIAPVSSRAVLDDALAMLGPDIIAGEAIVEVTGDWPELFASRDELTRLLQNLIGNALKYHEPDQPPQIEIHADATPIMFRVTIRDHGIGIDPNQTERLFKVFSRLQARTRFEGTGIGLALCRKIVEHHGGKIGVESAGEGQGSTFWFELPRIPTLKKPSFGAIS